MNVGGNGKALLTLSKQLIRDWNDIRATWQDGQSAHMDKVYMAPFGSAIDRSAPLFDQLDRVLAKIRSDCE